MAVSGMNGVDAYLNLSPLTTSSATTGKGANELGMEDFMNLLVAQLTNQDMLNPTSDTEFIAQLAQFSTLQGIQTLTEYQLSSYATSYVGKVVNIAHIGESGNLTKMEGYVDSVSFYDGEPKVIVNGISFPLYSVMEVKTKMSEDSGDGDGEDDKTVDPDDSTGNETDD